MKLIAEDVLDVAYNSSKGRRVRSGFEGFEQGFALTRRDVQLARGAFGDVGLNYVLDFFAEGLDSDCDMLVLNFDGTG